MNRKLVDPGLKRTGRIVVVSLGKGNKDTNAPRIIAIAGDDREGYLLLNADRYDFVPAVGMHVEFESVKGGPTGIYWRLTRQVDKTTEEVQVIRSRFLDNPSIAPGLGKDGYCA